MKSSIYILLTTFIIACFAACNENTPPAVELVKKPLNINKHVSKLLKKQLGKRDSTSRIVISGDTLFSTPQIAALYAEHEFKPLWTDKGILDQSGDSLFALLKHANEYGLVPANYRVNKIDSLLKTSDGADGIDAVKISNAELLLSDGLFKMAVHINKGRLDPDSLWPQWKMPALREKLMPLLTKAIHEKKLRSLMDSLEPRSEQYQQLKLALTAFRKEFSNSNWDSLPPIEKDTNTFYSLLKQRLIASHQYDSTLSISDEKKLIKALKKFQLQHGLNDDGKIGKYTYAALNVSRLNSERRIEVNMERWRWENDPGKRYAWVNIPSFKLKVLDADTIYTEAKVITGDVKHHTPTLKSSISYFIIYPYWNVPYKIASEEILPRIQWDTIYLHKNNFDVLDWNNNVVDPKTINWKKYNKTNLPYKFRQQEGEDNSLGVIKFMFNNPFGVYLHDTNSKRLFNKEVRALSHGCIRMENPWVLAEYLIKGEKKYNTDSLYTYYEKEQKMTIPLRKPLTLYIKYFTCEVDSTGQLMFYTDIYDLDKKMIKTLYR